MRFEVAVHVKRFVKHSRRRRKVWRPRVHSYFEATQHPRKGKGNGRINLQKKKKQPNFVHFYCEYILQPFAGACFLPVWRKTLRGYDLSVRRHLLGHRMNITNERVPSAQLHASCPSRGLSGRDHTPAVFAARDASLERTLSRQLPLNAVFLCGSTTM